MTNTIILLAVMASFIGYFIGKQTDSKKNRRVWRIVEDTPLSEQNVKDTLTKLGATDITEDKDDGGLLFNYQDERYGIHSRNTPAVFLANSYGIDESYDLDICEQAAWAFNNEYQCCNAEINREGRRIVFMISSFAPSCHILKEIFPTMVDALEEAVKLYREEYWTMLFRKSIKTN